MRFLTLSFLSLMLFSVTFTANALDGIPKAFTVGKTPLVLNGAGKRTKFIVTVYNAGMYLQKKNNNAQQIMGANETMVMRLKIVSGLASAEKMKQALIDGFKNATNGNTAPIQAGINQLMEAAFKQPVNKGDIFDLVYTPGAGTQVLKNAKRVAVIRGLAFKQALFGIWLSNKPAQASLKSQLLGG